MRNNTTRNSFLLFLTACIWGMAFVSQSKGMDYMHPFTFNGVRALIGALVLFIYLIVKRKIAGNAAKPIEWGVTLRAGIWCGLALTVASTLQQFGIKYTTVGKAGFITTLYIIFVPLAGIFLKRKVSAIVWMAAGMAAVGMYLLCMTESLTLGTGDIMVFLCAIVFAAHIMIIDYYAPKTDGVIVSCIQFTVCGVVCGIGAILVGEPTLAQLSEGLGTLLYAGVLSCGVAYTLQIVGQKGVNPTIAALIMSLESVVATVSGYIAYKIGFLKTDQTLTPRQIAGCVIVFVAVILVQLPKEWFSHIDIHIFHKKTETNADKSEK
ncbi:MAG: DMT family transporter [Lachnospiraceae bacterium]|nr:DMT family transporter [Lachnospiraceae bacterium]